ncbi:ABC-three component system middle component 6 [Enterococcus mundtii]|uniref:ABC-three component system middle component 6 n=1 Tax=Enterococcus mundtii TaxID=53346 RepID=UPI000E0007C2|nr:ABC-three component system middle component 6 [Enterococcus mundtii]STD27410.1 Uncharacterised protein [Enterococcus mundtii]
MNSVLINLDAKPNDSIYFIAGCVLEESADSFQLDILFEIVKNKYNKSLTYHDYMLALNFLFLLDKVFINGGGTLIVHRKNGD